MMTLRRILTAAGCAAATILLISVPIAGPAAAATGPCVTGTFGTALPDPERGVVLDGSVTACADAPAGRQFGIAQYRPGPRGVLDTSMMRPYAISGTASFRIGFSLPTRATTVLLCLLDHSYARLACHRIDFDASGGFTAQPLDVGDPMIPGTLLIYDDSGNPPDGNCGSCLGWVD